MGLKLGSTDIPAVRVTGGITPTGTINITENNIYDVTNYATANVNVSGGTIPTHTLTLDPSFTAHGYIAFKWDTTTEMVQDIYESDTLAENEPFLVWAYAEPVIYPQINYDVVVTDYDLMGGGVPYTLYIMAMPDSDLTLSYE